MARLAAATAVILATLAAPAAGSSTVRMQETTPIIRGDDGPNRIVVTPVDGGGRYAIDDPAGIAAGAGCVQETPTRASCPRIENPTICQSDACTHAVEAVAVEALGGNDDIRVGYGPAADGWPQTHAFVNAGAGDDFVGGTPVVDYELHGGPGDDVVDGAGFNDRLDGGGGRDVLFGGPGSDVLADGDDSARPDADVLDGGACTEPRCVAAGPAEPGDLDDTLSYEKRRAAVSVDLRSGEAAQGGRGERDVARNVENAWGGSGDDHLVGGAGYNRLIGGDGDDRLETADDAADFLNCDDGVDTAIVDGADDPFDCEALCARARGCERPRIVVRGVPDGRCVRDAFTARVRVRGMPGFRRLVARVDMGRALADTRRRAARFVVAMRGRRGRHALEIVVVGRSQGRRVLVTRRIVLDTCRPTS
ncbi:MAG TPA: calcium-binding protein [Solirubrobacteraceae bacterium]|nr:calcium-binding protein [Solirubrobacteraceae bacterium]